MYLWAYATKATVQPGNICIKQIHAIHGSDEASTTYTSLHTFLVTDLTFSTETLGHVIFPHKARDHVAM